MSVEDASQKWEPVVAHISPGDMVTSKKGILLKSTPEGPEEYCRAWAIEYLGDGVWRAVGETERAFVEKLPKGGQQDE